MEVEAPRAEFTDAALMRDWDRLASLFTPDGAWRMPYVNVEFLSRAEIRAGTERMRDLWDYFPQTTHPGTIELVDWLAARPSARATREPSPTRS